MEISYYNKLYRSCGSKELRLAEEHFYKTADDSEYAAMMYLQSLYDISFPEFNERFARFTTEVKNTNTGKTLERMLKVKQNIEPGYTPSTFTVTATDSSWISLSDYRGKYLLIYHWGLCPGTLWVHPKLLELHAKYHDKGFEILGFTDRALPEQLREDPEILPLFNQPWQTIHTSNVANRFISDEYYFSGVPILMLISPEGKTLFRGYSEVYEPLKELLQDKLGK